MLIGKPNPLYNSSELGLLNSQLFLLHYLKHMMEKSDREQIIKCIDCQKGVNWY